MSVTEQVARFAVDANLNDIPQKTVQYAKQLALSNLGSMIWGSTLSAGRIVTKFVRDIGGTSEAGVIGGGFKTSLPNAALANGNFAHAAEWEGDSRPEMVGVMTVFPVVFPVAEKTGASGKEVLAAAIIAHEVQSRIGLACLPATGRGFFAVPVFGNFGAAVAAARLLKLNPEQIGNAFGLVVSQAAGTLRHHSTMTHFVETGFACRNGVVAALLACGSFMVIATGAFSLLLLPEPFFLFFGQVGWFNKVNQFALSEQIMISKHGINFLVIEYRAVIGRSITQFSHRLNFSVVVHVGLRHRSNKLLCRIVSLAHSDKVIAYLSSWD